MLALCNIGSSHSQDLQLVFVDVALLGVHTLSIQCKDCTLHTPNVIASMIEQKQVLLQMQTTEHLSLEFSGPTLER
jgi:hypothetical protein